MNDDKFDPVLAEMVEREERSDWFERNLERRRLATYRDDPVGNLMFYQIANAVMVILIALGLYMLGQFDGIERGRDAASAKPEEAQP